MAVIAYTPQAVSPLKQAVIRTVIAGGTGEVGQAIYLNSSGQAIQANAGAAGTATTRGIVAAVLRDGLGQNTFAAGDTLDVVFIGPINGYSGMTPGTAVYQSNTAGRLDTAAGTVTKIVGFALDASTVFVNPGA